jgi:N-acetylmuramoyl-L-alanine amidase
MVAAWGKSARAAAIALTLAAGGIARAAPPADPAPTPVVAPALGVRFGGDTARTRLVLDLGTAAPRHVSVAQDEDRLQIDLPADAAPVAERGAGQGLVRRWSAQAQGPRLSLLFELAPGASVVRRFAIPPSADQPRWRYVVDLAPTDPLAALVGPSAPVGRPAAAPAVTARADSPAVGLQVAVAAPRTTAPSRQPPETVAVAARTPPSGVAARAPSATRSPPAERAATPKVIVIDAGHGGHDTGARSLVRNEKDINLAAALALKARLERTGRYRIVLTRGDDTFISLDQRVRIARAAKADLFISLHSDSAGQDPTPHGASVYTLSDHGVSRVREVLGPHEWFAHVGDHHGDAGVSQILLDLTQRSTRNRSAEFASLLIDHIGQSVDLLPRGHRDAGYYVLLAPDVPAVLVEMGFITNPGDELRLTDPDQRQKLMDRVGDAIDAYFAPPRQVAQG